MLKNYSIALILIVCLSCYDCKGYRSGGSRRTSSRRVATSSPKRYSQQSYAKPTPSYTNVQHATARPVQATPRQAARVTTPKYNIRTQPTVRYQPQPQPNYNQPGYNQPGYNQPGYHQPGYNQPGYNQPGYHQPGYNQPGHVQPNYNQPGRIQPNYNQPSYNQPHYQSGYQPNYGGYYPGKSNHGVRNAVFAGLGGSALGLYLGYKMGSWSNDNNHSPYGANYGANSGPNSGNVGDVPRYSVVHHYYHGDKPIPQNVEVENKTLATCANDTNFCTPNTSPLCMANGTIYCISPIDKTSPCDVNSTTLTCINSTITVPCVNDTNTVCNTTTVNTTISIPCVTNVTVFGNFADNKLTVQKISDASENATTITSEGISNKFCVTVIAEPVPKPVNMTNGEFMKYIDENPDIKEEEDVKGENFLKRIISMFLF